MPQRARRINRSDENRRSIIRHDPFEPVSSSTRMEGLVCVDFAVFELRLPRSNRFKVQPCRIHCDLMLASLLRNL